MAKVVVLFLVFIAVLGILGKIRLPKFPTSNRVDGAKRCHQCGNFTFDGIDCNCTDAHKQ